jgi:acetyl esterase/lipase
MLIHMPFLRLPASAYRWLARASMALPVTVAATARVEAQNVSPAAATPRRLGAVDIDTMSITNAGRRIAYGEDSLHFGELRLPAGLPPGTRVPVAIVLHGGCWTASFATVRNTAPLADALTVQGVATWNIEYRRGDSPGGGWPGTFLDVARATDHLRVLARQFPLDTNRVVAVGHSAGAQLSLWLAQRHTLTAASPLHTPSPLRVQGVVSLGGITDLEEFAQRAASGCGRGVARLLGAAPVTVPERVAMASPIRRLPLGVPTTHMAGDLDAIAPDSVRSAYVRAAVAAGDAETSNTTVPGGHFEVIAPTSPAGATAIRAVLTLLQRVPAPR